MAAHRLPDVTVVADAGMISEANQKAIEAEGLSFILGMKVPDVPYLVDQWRREHPGEEIPDGHVFVQPWPADPSSKRRDQWIYYQYRADRARRTLRGIDEQVAKAAKAVAGLARSSGTGSSPCTARSRASIASWPTLRSCSPPSPSAGGSRQLPAGRSAGSSGPPAATAPYRSRPVSTPSPPPTLSPTTSAKRSAPLTRQRRCVLICPKLS
jgi:hypothetical protein